MSAIDLVRIRTELDGQFPSIRFQPEVGSTNTELMEDHAAAEGTVLLADLQTAGRGRLGRVWTAPAGTQVAFSVLLMPRTLDHLGTLPLAAGLAITDAFPGTVLKWPNDVLLDGKKLCGILAEAGPVGESYGAQTEGEPAARVVLGIGINVSLTPEQLPVPTATSLDIAQGGIGKHDRTEVAIAVLRNLKRRLEQWEARDARLMDDYRAVCSSIGLRVRLQAPGGDIVGTVDGVAADGRIQVGGEYYSAGDVIHLRATE